MMETRRAFIVRGAAAAAFPLAGGCLSGLGRADGRDVVLRHAGHEVVIDPIGARVVSWRTPAGREVFFHPKARRSPPGKWTNGGVPVCWPWFGTQGPAGSSIHGTIRDRTFCVMAVEQDARRARAVLELDVKAGDNPFFAFDARVRLEAVLDGALTLMLLTTNVGARAFEFGGGFHPYFPCSAPENVRVLGMAEEPLTLHPGMDGARPMKDADMTVADRALRRSVTLRTRGMRNVVVWVPGKDEPAEGNLEPSDMPRFVCVEPCVHKRGGHVRLAPGESYEMATRFESVEEK